MDFEGDRESGCLKWHGGLFITMGARFSNPPQFQPRDLNRMISNAGMTKWLCRVASQRAEGKRAPENVI